MDYSIKYIEAYTNAFVRYQTKVAKTPNETICFWKDFVKDAIGFYEYSPPEFHNDIDVSRSIIDKLLVDYELLKSSEHKLFIEKINIIDDYFRENTFENPAWSNLDSEWYHKRVLKKAGESYATFFNNHFEKDYGVKVEIIEV